jgi:hypothetical protein
MLAVAKGGIVMVPRFVWLAPVLGMLVAAGAGCSQSDEGDGVETRAVDVDEDEASPDEEVEAPAQPEKSDPIVVPEPVHPEWQQTPEGLRDHALAEHFEKSTLIVVGTVTGESEITSYLPGNADSEPMRLLTLSIVKVVESAQPATMSSISIVDPLTREHFAPGTRVLFFVHEHGQNWFNQCGYEIDETDFAPYLGLSLEDILARKGGI